jgi:hypothetical protein
MLHERADPLWVSRFGAAALGHASTIDLKKPKNSPPGLVIPFRRNVPGKAKSGR